MNFTKTQKNQWNPGHKIKNMRCLYWNPALVMFWTKIQMKRQNSPDVEVLLWLYFVQKSFILAFSRYNILMFTLTAIFNKVSQNCLYITKVLIMINKFIPQGGKGTFLYGVQLSFSFNLLYMNIYTPEILSFIWRWRWRSRFFCL